METTALGFLYGPTLVLLAVGVLVTVARLRPAPLTRRRRGRGDDFGLLVPVATVPVEQADQLRAALVAAGVRATCAPAPPDPIRVTARGELLYRARERRHVLVFADDLPRATRTLARARGGTNNG